jgi:hypothetical protein
MRYAAKWWRNDREKAVATEYWPDTSDLAFMINDLAKATGATRIEVRDAAGELIAEYRKGPSDA